MAQSTMTRPLLSDIALFVEVAGAKSFTRAAHKLEVPASTLSRRIKVLERAVGLTLLHRTTRKVELSDAGAAYFARCAHLVTEASTAHLAIAVNAQVAQGTLRVACTADFATLYLAPLVIAFTQAHPAVNVELQLSPAAVDLHHEHVDCALRIGRLPDSPLVARRVATLALGLYAAPSYLRVAPPLPGPQALTQHMCIRMRSDEAGSTWRLAPRQTRPDVPLAKETQRVSVPVQGRFVVSSVFMIRELALQGAGIGVLDQHLAAPDVAAGRLVPVLPEWELAAVPLHLLTASRLVPAKVRLFGDLLAQRFA